MDPAATGREHLEFWRKHDVQSFVYVICGDEPEPVKVGKANDVRARIATLQTGNPQDLRLLYVLPGDAELEWQLHRRLQGGRVRGEWFAGPKLPALLRLVENAATAMVADENPDWREYIKPFGRAPKKGEVTVSHIEPNPVDPETALDRAAAHWTRSRRDGHLAA